MSLPESFGRYRVEKELGQGAMGRVYLAHDPAIDRKVAVKTIHLPAGLPARERDEALARFRREVQAAGRLSHPNIITIHDVGQDPDHGTYVAMELVDGVSLEEHARPGELLDPRRAASIVCQAADALAYAHRQGIVHRDIKPANLLLVDGRTVKIADFGLAKPTGASLTSDGTLLGTPYYMSPEQIRGLDVDGRSDLFSLGVVAYELFTGKRPFRGDSISTVIYRISHEPPVEPDLGRLGPGNGVKSFLARALAKRPEDRYPSGDEFARALREAVSASVAGPPVAAVENQKQSRPTAASGQLSAPKKGARPRRGGRRRRPGQPAGRPRRRPSLTPVLVLLVALLAAAFIFREPLFGLLRPAQEGIVVPGDTPADAGPAAPAGGSGGFAKFEEVTDGGFGAGVAVEPGGGTNLQAEEEEGGVQRSLPVMVTFQSDPPGAEFRVGDQVLPAGRLPAPAPGEEVEVLAVQGCRQGSRKIGAKDAGSDILIATEPAMRAMHLLSTPAGAAIQVNGATRGETPAELSLDGCAEQKLTLSLRGHRAWSRTFALTDGLLQSPAELTVDLVPIPRGTLLVPGGPFPVSITLEGGRRLRSGERVILEEATYRLTLENLDLMFKKVVKVSVHGDQTVEPKVQFPAVAQLTVRAQPSNATIEVRRSRLHRSLGAPPLFNEKLAAGTYTVTCKFAHNNEEQEQTVTLEAGENPPVVFVAGQQ